MNSCIMGSTYCCHPKVTNLLQPIDQGILEWKKKYCQLWQRKHSRTLKKVSLKDIVYSISHGESRSDTETEEEEEKVKTPSVEFRRTVESYRHFYIPFHLKICSSIFSNFNILFTETLSGILMANGIPADILTETINTVAEVIRGNLTNQEYFANVMAPSNPPRPAIVVLLMSMVNEKQPFVLRCAVLYCFQCFLFKNEIGQEMVVQTLLPSNTGELNLVFHYISPLDIMCIENREEFFGVTSPKKNYLPLEQTRKLSLITLISSNFYQLVHIIISNKQ